MKLWEADDESLDLMEAAAEMAIAAEQARARRVDPGGIISKSHGMSAVKLRQALGELRSPPVKEWSDYDDDDKNALQEAIQLFQTQKDDGLRAAAFKRLRYHCLRRHAVAQEIPIGNDGSSQSQKDGSDAGNATRSPSKRSLVRKLPSRKSD